MERSGVWRDVPGYFLFWLRIGRIVERALARGQNLPKSRASLLRKSVRIGGDIAKPARDFLNAGLRRERHEDLRVDRCVVRLALQNNFLAQFFAGTKAGVDDWNLVVALVRQADQVMRKIGDLDRIAHVQHEDVTVVSERGCLEDERNRLRRPNEIPRRFGMRDRDRSSRRDLFHEEGNDAA